MRAEIVSIGTELLLGQIVDTNATYLARVLADHGIDLFFKQTVGDNAGRIQDAVRLALSRADLILTTGGLGPTEDDLTIETVARLLDRPLEEDAGVREHIRGFFATRRRPAPAGVYKQALVPRGATVIPNRRGTAPGVAVAVEAGRGPTPGASEQGGGGQTIIMMPGVPAEMEGMVAGFVIPWLRERVEETVIRSRVLRIAGLGESAVEERVKDLLHHAAPTIAPLAKLGEVHLRVTAKGRADEVTAHLDRGEALLRERLGALVFGTDEETLESAVGRLLRERGRSIAVAESSTGGLIADRLTNVPGASAYFRQGVVAYSDEAKVTLLGVSPELLERHGAVSAPVAQAMALGVRRAAGSDLGLAVTGIAGPTGGSAEKPVGLVYIALSDGAGDEVQEFRFGTEAGRRGIKYLTSQAALNLVRLRLLG